MRVRVFVPEWIDMKREIAKQVMERQAQGLCVACGEVLQPDETKTARVVRGCHEKCAKAIYRAIEAGKTTDAKQIAIGRWLEPASPGCKPTNPVTMAINAS